MRLSLLLPVIYQSLMKAYNEAGNMKPIGVKKETKKNDLCSYRAHLYRKYRKTNKLFYINR